MTGSDVERFLTEIIGAIAVTFFLFMGVALLVLSVREKPTDWWWPFLVVALEGFAALFVWMGLAVLRDKR